MFELLKNWGDLKKGATIKLLDQSVIDKGLKDGLLKLVKKETK